MENQFDLILASAPIYLPECVESLFKSMSFFLKKNGDGKILMVNNSVRLDPEMPRIKEEILPKYKLLITSKEQ